MQKTIMFVYFCKNRSNLLGYVYFVKAIKPKTDFMKKGSTLGTYIPILLSISDCAHDLNKLFGYYFCSASISVFSMFML